MDTTGKVSIAWRVWTTDQLADGGTLARCPLDALSERAAQELTTLRGGRSLAGTSSARPRALLPYNFGLTSLPEPTVPTNGCALR
jgi:hypothetical protein